MDGKTGTNGIPAAHIPSPAGRMKAGFEENGLPTEIGGLPLMPDEQSAEKIAELFKLISDGTRLRVLVLLCISEKCVSEIADAFGMSLPAVSHHLRVLKQAEIISSRRDGMEVYYSLAANAYADLVRRTVTTVFDCKCTSCLNAKTGCGKTECNRYPK